MTNPTEQSFLKLTTKKNDPLTFETSDGPIEITILRTEQTRILIKAPRAVKITRRKTALKAQQTEDDLIAEFLLLQKDRLEELST